MKKFFILALSLTLSIGCIANAATDDKTGSISVQTSTFREVSPNIAEMSIEVKTYDKSMQKAAEENKRISNDIYASVKSIINPANGDYVRTSNFTTNPQYNYSGNKKTFDKYEVSNSIVVKVNDLSVVSKIIDTSISKGATNIDNLKFSVSNYDQQCNEMLATITKSAYSQANAVAASINSRISGIKSISAYCSTKTSRTPIIYKSAMALNGVADEAATTSTPVESGKIIINSNVNADFYVINK